MSRIGNNPIALPQGVEVVIEDGLMKVKGPKGELSKPVFRGIDIKIEDNVATVSRENETKVLKSAHGLIRSLLANMVTGVSQGFEKTLDIIGVGYRATAKGADIELAIGYSKPVSIVKPDGIEFEMPTPNKIIVKGIDKELVGQTAANIRKIRAVEPYKGKGIRYTNEYVRRKAGKAGAK